VLVDAIDDPKFRCESLCGQNGGAKDNDDHYTEGKCTQIYHVGFLNPSFGDNPGATEKLLLRVKTRQRETAWGLDVVGFKAKVIVRRRFVLLDGMGSAPAYSGK
jgi:hypothetical protein